MDTSLWRHVARALAAAILCVSACRSFVDPLQQSPSTSPAGDYTMRMERNGGPPPHRRVHITTARDGITFEDDHRFPVQLGVYWTWTPDNELWVYDDDVGETFVYRKTEHGWSRSEWVLDASNAQVAEYVCGYATETPNPAPPSALLKFYTRSQLASKLSKTLDKPCPAP